MPVGRAVVVRRVNGWKGSGIRLWADSWVFVARGDQMRQITPRSKFRSGERCVARQTSEGVRPNRHSNAFRWSSVWLQHASSDGSALLMVRVDRRELRALCPAEGAAVRGSGAAMVLAQRLRV